MEGRKAGRKGGSVERSARAGTPVPWREPVMGGLSSEQILGLPVVLEAGWHLYCASK